MNGRQRLRVGVIFGGRSGEHEVSLMSARSVIGAMDPSRYQVVPIGITREGRWVTGDSPELVMRALETGQAEALAGFMLPPEPGDPARHGLDVIFPVLHGPLGEDGTVQGVLEMAEIPYVGAGVAASAVGMDKELMRAAFAAAGLPVMPWAVVRRGEWVRDPEALARRLLGHPGLPAFVKPANLGSSVGVASVEAPEALHEAVEQAFRFDRKVVVEGSARPCREVECSVLGNEEAEVSIPGEILPARAFYDYEAKYRDPATRLLIPAPLEPTVRARVQELARQAFRAVDAAGMARVDFFIREGVAPGQPVVVLNEINTIPGFTDVSMYPKLWEASGLPYPELIDRLIGLALEAHQERLRVRQAQTVGASKVAP